VNEMGQSASADDKSIEGFVYFTAMWYSWFHM